MSCRTKICLIVTVAGLGALLLGFSPGYPDQEKRIDPRLLEEIAGRFEFHFDGGSQVIVFSHKDGTLMAGLEGELPNELRPIDAGKLTFVATPPEGPEYHYRFLRDGDGKINRCHGSISSMGIEAEGTRIKEEG